MERAQARGLSRSRIARLLSVASDELSIGARISLLSNELLGYPYSPNPLIGSAETAEVFTASLDGFDCVTFIETVLALARSFDIDEFVTALRRIRYDGGCVRWERRNHYMTSWIRNNAREGIVGPIATSDLPMVVRERVLDVVPGLA
ncbi:MAG TPA: N-acetylmuramoyl-L-alanine amidase-like domain-containing protein, partial [Candidatus Binataceae bacterium]|nr:N-acetylmuramoyl-L-alanine amidase-like domain-containing protein [Candidatus Binataceae bacterium]